MFFFTRPASYFWSASLQRFVAVFEVMNLPRLAKYYAELRITDELEHVRNGYDGEWDSPLEK
jgi:hypothetical protein